MRGSPPGCAGYGTAVVDDERNWARNITYSAPVQHPDTVERLQEAVAGARHAHALGTRHSFSTCADTDGLLVALDRIAPDLQVDEETGTATVGAAIRLGDLGRLLAEHGRAIANLPSLPHISLGGAVATATHGSGDGLGMLATFVRAIEVVGPAGILRRFDGADLAGAVMAYGALGDRDEDHRRHRARLLGASGLVRRDAVAEPGGPPRRRLRRRVLGQRLHAVDRGRPGALVKSTDGVGHPGELFGAAPTPRDPAEIAADTKHTPIGDLGPSWDRLPHFRLAAVPSVGEELQSEYFVPRDAAQAALAALRELGEDLDAALHVSELRTVAADDLWLSPAAGADVLAIGFTWRDAPELVLPLLPRIEERLLPLGARPHLAKLFHADAAALRDRSPGWDDFARLRDRVDPDRVFGNPFLERTLGS